MAELLNGLAQVARVGTAEVERDRAEPPADEQGERGEQQRSADAVGRAGAGAQTTAQSRGDASEGHREKGSDQNAGADGDKRRILRLRPSSQQLRADPRSQCCSADESRERQRAGDQASLIAQRSERDDEEDDAGVYEIQSRSREATTFCGVLYGSPRYRNASARFWRG